MKNIKKIHFVGMKGVGMTPLAIIAKEAGFVVSGCDVGETFITDDPLKKAGISCLEGFLGEHVKGVDLVITTGAHGGFNNEEVKLAQASGSYVLTQGQAVGVFMKGEIFGRNMEGISVGGSHGKTTTTALIATILKKNGMDPSYVIGTGIVPSIGSPGHFGKGKYFVAEADEYATEPTFDPTPKFLWQNPKIAVFTNIELDHPDVYPDEDAIREAFLIFANQLPSDGSLIAFGDDPQIQKLLKGFAKNVITYGTSSQNDFVINKISSNNGQVFFWLEGRGATFGEFCLPVIGEHNAFNATASVITALETGLTVEAIKKALLTFTGSKRRSEYIGSLGENVLVYDDYGHHPTEISKTLSAFKKNFPGHKIICVFQPHSYSRTKKLFEHFVHSFRSADEVILIEIYPSFRETYDPEVSSRTLADEMNKFYPKISFLSDPVSVVKYIQGQKLGKTVILTMGAGDVYKIGEELVFG